MNSIVDHTPYKLKVVSICEDLLSDRIGIIEASRLLRGLSFHLALEPATDADFVTFIGIDSETDHLPVGNGRDGWAADALARKDAEVKDAEAFFRERAFESALNLIVRYKRQAEQGAAANP